MDCAKYSIKQLEKYLETIEVDEKVISNLQKDPRKGVRDLAKKYRRLIELERVKVERWHLLNKKAVFLRKNGFELIAGVDEAGRGPLAGPVVAAAVILDPAETLLGLDDSKNLTVEERERLFALINQQALAVGTGIVDNHTIDQLNILQATFEAMRKAVRSLVPLPEYLLIDGNCKIPHCSLKQETVIDGDRKVNAIAAASIVAKVTRDRLLEEYHQQYPQYGLIRNKGYGTKEHIEALKQYGPSSLHRFTFSIVNKYNYIKTKNQILQTDQPKELIQLGETLAASSIFTAENLVDLRKVYRKQFKKISKGG